MEEFHRFELIQTLLFVFGAGIIAYSPIARAIGKRIMHGKVAVPGTVQEDPRIEDISGEVAALRQAMYEQQERLDFAERMLAQNKARDALPGVRQS
jgi:hypothetical protein